MKFILNFIYTCRIDLEKLTTDHLIEIYHATNYFELCSLEKCIIEFTKQVLEYGSENLGKKLLSEFVEKFSFDTENEMEEILVNWMAKIPLVPDDAKNDLLSLNGLQFLLCKTYNTVGPFATFELEIFKYAIAKVLAIISNDLEFKDKQNEKEYDSIIAQKKKTYLKPLIPYIDLLRIESDYLIKVIEPMNVFTNKMITDAYRFKAQEQSEFFRSIRGVPIFRWNEYDSLIYTSNDGFTLQADPNLDKYKHVTGNLIIREKGTYEWDIIIERLCKTVYIGVCDHKIFREEKRNDQYYCGWVFGSDGFIYNKNNWRRYDENFKEGDMVTVHLNMSDKTCAFSVNHVRYEEIFEWKDIPSEVCPVVSLKQGTRIRIQPHMNGY